MKKLISLLFALISFGAMAQTDYYAKSVRFATVDTTSVLQQDGKFFWNNTYKQLKFMNNSTKYFTLFGTGFNSGYLPKASGTSLLGNSLVYDNGTNVGIGTTTTGSKLTVNGTIAAAGRIWTGGAYNYYTNAASGYYASGDGSTTTGMYESSGALRFKTASTDRLTITSAGDVGIGTTSPENTLHVYAASATARLQNSTGTSTTYYQTTNTGGSAYFGLNSSTGSPFFGSSYALNIYHSGSYPIVFSNAGTERMRIDNSGNVMIGATSPFAKLHVQGSSYTSDIITLQRSTGGAVMDALFFWDGSSPMTTSQVKGDNLVLQNEGGSDLILGTNGLQRLRINGVGAFGIGTNYGSSGQVMVTNGSGGPPSWTTTTGITGLGTISTGVWQGTAIADSYISSAATWNAKVGKSSTLTANEFTYATSGTNIASTPILQTDGNSVFVKGSGLDVSPLSPTSNEGYIKFNGTIDMLDVKSVTGSGAALVKTALKATSEFTTVGSKLAGFGTGFDLAVTDASGVETTSQTVSLQNRWVTVGTSSEFVVKQNGVDLIRIPGSSAAYFSGGVVAATTLEGADLNVSGNATISGGTISSGLNTNITLDANGTGVVVIDGMTVRRGSASLDFPNTAAGATSSLTITVTGVATGDPVFFGQTYSSGYLTARCSAANTVTVTFHNDSGVSVDLASGTYKVVTYSF